MEIVVFIFRVRDGIQSSTVYTCRFIQCSRISCITHLMACVFLCMYMNRAVQPCGLHSLVNLGRLVLLSTTHLALTGFFAPGQVSRQVLLNCVSGPHVCCCVLINFELHPAGHSTIPKTAKLKVNINRTCSTSNFTINGHDRGSTLLI